MKQKGEYLIHVISHFLSFTFIYFFDVIQNCVVIGKLVSVFLHGSISFIRWKVVQKQKIL